MERGGAAGRGGRKMARGGENTSRRLGGRGLPAGSPAAVKFNPKELKSASPSLELRSPVKPFAHGDGMQGGGRSRG